MSIRLAKQIVYMAFYIVLWFFIIWDGYSFFIRPAPSCFDHIQNQGEQGVDCGGPCATVCAASTQPIAVQSVNAFAASAGADTFLAKIANANAGDSAQSFDYSFNVYDASGTLLKSYPGQSYLYGQQLKYLVLVNQPVPDGVANADLTITNVNWVKDSAIGAAPQIAVQDVSTQIATSSAGVSGAIVATGQIANNDVATFNDVLVVVVFKDSNGNPVGASQTEIDSIAPTQIENFAVNYPFSAGINPDATEVEAYTVRQ